MIFMYTFFVIYICIAIAMFCVTIKDFNNIAVTPKEIYECNDLNMFACVVLFMIMLVFNPLFYIFQFLYWIFHVERED